jgi:death-on-curing protein
MINSEYIIKVNSGLGYSVLSKALVDSALSSYFYYDTIYEQIASIMAGIARNHAFSDGNKRTAVSVAIILFKNNNYNYIGSDSDLIELVLSIVTNRLEVEAISNKLKQLFVKE